MQVTYMNIYLKCHSSTSVFQTFPCKNQLPGFYISGTLVKNRLIRLECSKSEYTRNYESKIKNFATSKKTKVLLQKYFSRY